jgi:hypothetical protein
MSNAALFSAAFGHSRSQLDGLKNVLRLSRAGDRRQQAS